MQDRRVGWQVGGDRGGGEPAAVRDLGGAGGHAAGALGLGGVAGHALLRLALDHGRDVDAQLVGLADVEHLDRAREALQQRVVDALVDERAGGGGALLAGVDERGGDQRGDDLVEVGVGVHDHAVLAAHLGDHALEVLLALADLGGLLDDLQADGAGAGEGDRVHARVLDQRGADLALAGQQRDRVGRHAAPRAARWKSISAQPGACSAGLSTTALPVASPAAVIPSGIASGKFQGAMTATTPRGP